MHLLCCPCNNLMYPYYPPGYRPPNLSQPPPIPRPSYLHHYQYTQLHVNPPYNVSFPPALTQPPFPIATNQSSVEIAFEPPPRDRRTVDKPPSEEPRITEANRNPLLQFPVLNDHAGSAPVTGSIDQLQGMFKHLTAAQVASLTTDNYVKYLDNGCFIGETIAKRNEQRPCFKNIQNLCNRTRSEVIKPNITVSNIHSQGVPWATKDFIFAFVRAINCWCILRGYLGSKDGHLGKIDREISPEFRECYENWERCTKQLTHYLIQTFHNLDEANLSSNLAAGPSTSTSNVHSRTKYTSPSHEAQRKVSAAEAPLMDIKTKNKETAFVKKIPGILHIRSSSSVGEACNPTSVSTEISPRDEESDNERRIYMKPGSYNVPTKNRSTSPPTNSPQPLDFPNKVKLHHSDTYNSDDQVWQTAQSVTPDFIKQNEETAFSNSVKKIYDMSIMPNKQIESWLNNERNIFGYIGQDADEEHLSSPGSHWKTTSDNTNLVLSTECEVTSQSYRTTTPIGKEYSEFRNNTWEFKNGGITKTGREVFETILKELERMEFVKNVNLLLHPRLPDPETRYPSDFSMILKKLNSNMYCYVNEVVHDFRHFITCAQDIHSHDRYIMTQIGLVEEIFEKTIKQAFSGLDFSHITGEATDTLGCLVMKECGSTKRHPEGDGDH